MKRPSRKVGKYEVGRTVGEGTFAKVKFARNTETGESVAMKVLAKSSILKHKMVEQVLQKIVLLKRMEVFNVYVLPIEYSCHNWIRTLTFY